METAAGDGASTPRSEGGMELPVQKSLEETVVETVPKETTAKEEERSSIEEGEGGEEPKEEKEDTSTPIRKERSVMFASEAGSEAFRTKESWRLPSVPEADEVTPTPQPSSSFGLLRKLTTELFSLPFGFFQSRAEVRTWGEEQLADPSVQPRSPSTAHYGLGALPNYPKSSFFFFQPRDVNKESPQFYSLAPKGGYRPVPGVPALQFIPAGVQMPQVTPMNFPSYKWNDLKEYRMDTVPYVNARMTPADPTRMYVGGNYLVGYPYGVPAVEENEATPLVTENCKCNFMCW